MPDIPADAPNPPPAPPDDGTTRHGVPRPSTWSLLRPLVLRLHFYAGLFVAPFILVAAVTGLLYVWTPQLEQAVYAHELRVPVGAEPLPLHQQIAAARAAAPDAVAHAVRPGGSPEETTRVLFDTGELAESTRLAVFVDPYTGEVRGTLDSYGSSGALPVRGWIDLLHRELHLGDAGRLYSELAASWLWLVAAGGVAMWVTRRRRRRVRGLLVPEPRARGSRRTLSFHGTIGLWAFVGLLLVSATGLTWSQYAGENVTSIRSALSWQTPAVSAEIPADSPGPVGVDVGVDRALAAARAAGLEGPVEVILPAGGDTGYTISELDRSWPTRFDSVAVDPSTGQITDTVRFADFPLMAKLARWGIDAHMGLLFGVPNQLVLTALALGLATVIALGYRMWWRRRPAARPGIAPVWRALPWHLRGAVVVVFAGLGLLMPLLGASLLLFVAGDLLLTRRGGGQAASTGVPRA
ncbi:PepSY-associated TM helix domain-containing protein [Marinactinospora rubrisoli]|uniref:PepSY-associated TM helix domain-containing protein n=1 Tax=Marinactinospora rubrisoli TaxID=2715399 RepID=A0ABW2KD65_9ACTN